MTTDRRGPMIHESTNYPRPRLPVGGHDVVNAEQIGVAKDSE